MATAAVLREPGVTARATRRWTFVALAVGFLLQLAWRVWLARSVAAPIAHFDEDDYLLIARYLAGGPESALYDRSPLRPMGYPLLLAPLYWITDDPHWVFRGAQFINALLSAAAFPLAYVAVRRWLASPQLWAYASAFVAALLPASVYYSSAVLTESLFLPLLLGWLLLLESWLATPPESHRRLSALAAGLVAGYAAVSHVRGLVIASLHVIVCIGVVFLGRTWRPNLRLTALGSSAAVIGVYWVGRTINEHIESVLYPSGTWHANVLERLSTPAGWVRVLCDGLGQLWYLSVGTWLLAALGIAAAVNVARDRNRDGSVRVVLFAALMLTVVTALATASGIPDDENRVNNHIQGRYILFTTTLWVVLALAWLRGWPRGGVVRGFCAAVAGTGVCAAAVLAYAADRFPSEVFITFDNLEVAWLAANNWASSLTATNFIQVSITSFALGGLAVAACLAVKRPRLHAMSYVVMGLLVALNVSAMSAINRNISAAWVRQNEAPAPPLVSSSIVRAESDTVAAAIDVNPTVFLRHQRQVWWSDIERFDARGGSEPPPDATVLVLPVDLDARSWNSSEATYVLIQSVHEPIGAAWAVWRRMPSPSG